MLSIWAGRLLDPEKPILLVLESDQELEKVLPLFVRTGYAKFAAYLVGGMSAHGILGLLQKRFPAARLGTYDAHRHLDWLLSRRVDWQ
jgi:hypothetical protein